MNKADDMLARIELAIGSMTLVEKQLLYIKTVLTPISEKVSLKDTRGQEDFLDLKNQPPISAYENTRENSE